jgi:hypothetical protein
MPKIGKSQTLRVYQNLTVYKILGAHTLLTGCYRPWDETPEVF